MEIIRFGSRPRRNSSFLGIEKNNEGLWGNQDREEKPEASHFHSFLDSSINGVSRRKRSIETKNTSTRLEDKLNESWILSNFGLRAHKPSLGAQESKIHSERLKEHFSNSLKQSQFTRKDSVTSKDRLNSSLLAGEHELNCATVVSPKHSDITEALKQQIGRDSDPFSRKSVSMKSPGSIFGSKHSTSLIASMDERHYLNQENFTHMRHSIESGTENQQGKNMVEIIGAIDSLKNSVANLKALNKSQISVSGKADRPPQSKQPSYQHQMRRNTVSILSPLGNQSNFSSVQSATGHFEKKSEGYSGKIEREKKLTSSRESSLEKYSNWNQQKGSSLNSRAIKQPEEKSLVSGPVRNLQSILENCGNQPSRPSALAGASKSRYQSSLLSSMEPSGSQRTHQVKGISQKDQGTIHQEGSLRKQIENKLVSQKMASHLQGALKTKNYSVFHTIDSNEGSHVRSGITRLGRNQINSSFNE